MNLLLTCADATRLATEHLDGSLSAPLSLRLRAHLGLCRTCRAFLDSLQSLPALVGGLAQSETPEPRLESKALLASVMARLPDESLRPALKPIHAIPPEAREAVDSGTADLPMRALAAALHALQTVGPVPEAPHLPASVRDLLPDPSRWRWQSFLLGGCRIAELARDPASGARLHMIVLPPEARFPDHRHAGDEDFLVLCGHAEDEAHYLSPGDWLRSPGGSGHRHIQGRVEACWALARTEGPEVALEGWRGSLARMFGA